MFSELREIEDYVRANCVEYRRNSAVGRRVLYTIMSLEDVPDILHAPEFGAVVRRRYIANFAKGPGGRVGFIPSLLISVLASVLAQLIVKWLLDWWESHHPESPTAEYSADGDFRLLCQDLAKDAAEEVVRIRTGENQ